MSYLRAPAAPSYSPAPGNYTANQSVTITTPTTGATIRYTTDGTVPSQTNGTTYTGPVSVAANETLKAYAYETGYTDSPLTSGGYTVQTGGSVRQRFFRESPGETHP